MEKIFINQRPFEVHPHDNLLAICLSLGFNLPYFCWHPALGSVGACRQCAVKQFKDENDQEGRLVMACLTPAAEGTRISIEDPEASAFRASVIEWLMINHPHDCPVCDEGGECHLQDMTVMTGHTYRRNRTPKRTYRNQDLGPFLNHEMNRCIQCYRCVRFYRDHAGGRDLNVFGSRDRLYFGRYEDGTLENEFSGNLVEVCPTGVFTDKTLMPHYTRKWDLQMAPSICPHCSLGCNTTAGERQGILRRITNRYNRQINGYFLCDRGRFGYEFVNRPDRIKAAFLLKRQINRLEQATGKEILQHLKPFLSNPERLIGIGSPRASLESNFALQTLVGRQRFFSGISTADSLVVRKVTDILRSSPIPPASIQQIEEADAVLVLGEDLIHTAPRIALAIRQAVRQQPMEEVDNLEIPRWHDAAVREVIQNKTGPLYVADIQGSWLDDIATWTYHAHPDDIARLGFAVAHALDPNAPVVSDLSQSLVQKAQEIADVLLMAKKPVVISGTSTMSTAVVESATNVALALRRHERPVQLCFALPECNSLGVNLLGDQGLEHAFQIMKEGKADIVLILENDLYRRADHTDVDQFLRSARQVIVLDHLATSTTAKSHVLLPASTFAESTGTIVNNEGRAQRHYQVFQPEGEVQESWRWIRNLAENVESNGNPVPAWRTLDDITSALSKTISPFQRLHEKISFSKFSIHGQQVPRATHRYSGRTALVADRTIHEPKPPVDKDSPLIFSMEGTPLQPPSSLIPFFWTPGWNSIQALNKFQSEVGGDLCHDTPGVLLFEPQRKFEGDFFLDIPPAFQPRADQWLVFPLHQIFGSEELSIQAPSVAERQPKSYLFLNPEDAHRHDVKSDDHIEICLQDTFHSCLVQLHDKMPQGIAGVPLLPAVMGMTFPVWSHLKGVNIP